MRAATAKPAKKTAKQRAVPNDVAMATRFKADPEYAIYYLNHVLAEGTQPDILRALRCHRNALWSDEPYEHDIRRSGKIAHYVVGARLLNGRNMDRGRARLAWFLGGPV